MDIIDEMEFERIDPICFCCGKRLTKEEWECNGDMCDDCCAEAIDEDRDIFDDWLY